jgi:hypothetical protein
MLNTPCEWVALDGGYCGFAKPHFKSPARRNDAKKSLSTSANFLPAMELRATKINSMGWVNSCWCSRKLSRSRRRARTRCTAPPIFLLVTTPNLGLAPSGSLFQFATRQPARAVHPAVGCGENPGSASPAKRGPTATVSALGRSWTRESDRCQTFAALAAAIGQNGAATFAGITVQKSVLAFAADFRRLILAFHKFKYSASALK